MVPAIDAERHPNSPIENDDASISTSALSILSVQSSTSSSVDSLKSSSGSTKTGSTSRSKSSTSSAPKSSSWKQATDPLGMSTKSVGPGFMPMFNTHLYSPGFHSAGNTKVTEGPKAYQAKQLKFKEKKRTESSAASTKSGTSSKSVLSSGSSSKSSFFSSLTGNLNTQSEVTINSNTNDTKETGEEVGSHKDQTSNETEGAPEDSTAMGSEETTESDSDEQAIEMTTAELTIVVEDHSSLFPLPDAMVQPLDGLHPGSIESPRRPSTAESVNQLQPPMSPQLGSFPHNELLLKRVTSWEYLGWVHNGKTAYYNTILLTEADLRKFYTPELVQKRTHQYFLLGTAIANILEIPHLSDYARALSATLHEYEHFLSADSKLNLQNFFRTGRKASDSRSFEETGEYTYFDVRPLPFDMDYTIVFATLCEMTALAYKKFDTPKATIITGSEVFHKIDVRLKKIMNNATKELETMAREALQEELNFIDPISSMMIDWDMQAMALGH
ncbi:hypothetical protein B0O80DRAFT_90162 [Mortierella sp. GBAus27b]|nr:hypothetical protein B0O80DRAFT_90162 [Mortierella sp. GBAus27b]